MDKNYFSSVSFHDLCKLSIRTFYTWPLAPSGTLKKPSRTYEVKKDSDQNQKDFEQTLDLMNSWIQVKATIMMFIIAVIIGIVGNFYVSLTLDTSLNYVNTRTTWILFFSILLLTYIGALYAPTYSKRYYLNCDYDAFPSGYEHHIDVDKLRYAFMKLDVHLNGLDDIITNYSIFIRCCLMKDALVSTLSNLKYLRVKQIRRLSPLFPSYDLQISTNLFALLEPGNAEKISREFIEVNGAVLNAQMNAGVYAIELDHDEWEKRGTWHINELLHLSNSFDRLHQMNESYIMKSTNLAFCRYVMRRLRGNQ